MIVLGPTTDVRAVAVFADALRGTAPVESSDLRKLSKAVDTLQSVLNEKLEEQEMFNAARQRQDEVGSELTDAEKVSLNRFMTGAFTAGTQGPIWSSMVMLILGLGVLTALRRLTSRYHPKDLGIGPWTAFSGALR